LRAGLRAIPRGAAMKTKKAAQARYAVFCCQGGDCIKNGGKEVLKALKSEIKAAGLKDEVTVTKTHCNGMCKIGPVVVVCSGGCVHGGCGSECGIVWYQQVNERDAQHIVADHLQHGQPVEKKRMHGLIHVLATSDEA
jgi:(2Fe-2S) ferredoxin